VGNLDKTGHGHLAGCTLRRSCPEWQAVSFESLRACPEFIEGTNGLRIEGLRACPEFIERANGAILKIAENPPFMLSLSKHEISPSANPSQNKG
jgi:hypothetical protein